MIDKRAFGKLTLDHLGREVERLKRAAPPSATGAMHGPAAGLEKIIRGVDRPTLLVEDNSFHPAVLPTWRAVLENARPHLEHAIRSVGRVEIELGRRREMLGTAWVVAPGVVVTNRHVATLVARYGADGTFPLRADPIGRPLQVFVEFKGEHGEVTSFAFRVEEVLHMEPDDDASPDVAFLRIAAKSRDASLPPPPPIALASAEPLDSQLVACIGFPAEDPDELDVAALRAYFNNVYEVKRVAPGKIGDEGKAAWSFKHDCTTLGGSSGSPLVDLVDGTVVGMHFSGVSGTANFAIRPSALTALLGRLGLRHDTTETVRVGEASAPTGSGAKTSEEATGSKHTPAYFEGRDGYSMDFLGVLVPLPTPSAARMAEAARTTDVDDNTGIELRYRHFSVIHNAERRLPWITAVNINGMSLRRPPRPSGWYRDGRVDPAQQAGNEVYTNSGFSRGHMVRRLDACWGTDEAEIQQANADTFHFTNACPQEQNKFNDKLWGDLEDYILDEADADDIRISVFTGPIFGEDDPVLGDLPIPLLFWKVVAWRDNGRLKAVGFVLSQRPHVHLEFVGGPYRTSERSLPSIARDAGIEFDPQLLAADLHSGEESPPRPLESLAELSRHFSGTSTPR